MSDEVWDIINRCELNFADVNLAALNSDGHIAKIVLAAYDEKKPLSDNIINISSSISEIADKVKQQFNTNSKAYIDNIKENIPKVKQFIESKSSHSVYVEYFAHIWAICKYHDHNPTETFRLCRGCGGLKSTVANTI